MPYYNLALKFVAHTIIEADSESKLVEKVQDMVSKHGVTKLVQETQIRRVEIDNVHPHISSKGEEADG